MRTALKLLIVSTYFPPMNAVAAQRVVSFARHWSRMGHSVTVLTPARSYEEVGASGSVDGYRVLRIPVPIITSLRDRVRKPVTISFPKAGSSGSISTISPHHSRGATPTRSIVRRLADWRSRTGAFYGVRMPDVHDLWVLAALKRATAEQWDGVVTTSGPYSTHLVGYLLRRQGHAQRWVMDYRDLWSDNHLFPGLPIVKRIERRLEAHLAGAADAITTVSEPLAKLLKRSTPTKVYVVFNGFEEEDVNALPTKPAFVGAAKRVVYTGTIYAVQDPSPLFTAVRNLAERKMITKDQLELVFAGARADVRDLAAAYGIETFVQYHGELNREQALSYQRDADALLLLQVESSRSSYSAGVLTGKLFEYLSTERPILAIGQPADNSVAELLRKTVRGIALGRDVVAIEAALLKLVKGIPLLEASNRQAQQELAKYTRRHQAERMLDVIENA